MVCPTGEVNGKSGMNTLYEKSKLGFSLAWIGIYCVGMSAFDALSRRIGVESAASAIFALALSLYLCRWVCKSGLRQYFGLCKGNAPARAFLFYLPLMAITAFNLWGGISLQYDALGTVCFIVKMLCVGFLEELLFRGFLFRALARSSIKWAVVISSLTFGLGHILNLINGSGMGVAENLVQIVGAVLMGFLYVVIAYCGGSLWPCVLSHGLFNALSAFSPGNKPYLFPFLCAITLIYAIALLKLLPAAKQEKKQ